MVEVDYLAILLAGIVTMVIGFLWYGPLFSKPWMKEMGVKDIKKGQSGMGKTYAVSFVLSLLTAYILTHVMTFSESFYGYPLMTTGLTSALSMWLGFVMPVQATDVLFGGRSFKLFTINTGYQLASLLGMGITIALFG